MNHLENPDQTSSDERPRHRRARYWMARLAFSFCALGVVLAFEGWKAYGVGHEVRAAALFAGGVAGGALGMMGLRMRHRPGE